MLYNCLEQRGRCLKVHLLQTSLYGYRQVFNADVPTKIVIFADIGKFLEKKIIIVLLRRDAYLRLKAKKKGNNSANPLPFEKSFVLLHPN